MNPTTRAKLFRFSFLLNAFIFLIGALGLFEQGKNGLAILQFVTVLFNLYMFFKKLSPTKNRMLNYIILILNILVAASVAIDYHIMGKDRIKYLWFIAACMYLVALIVQVRKAKTSIKKL